MANALGSIAKAITAFVVVLVLGFATNKGLIVDENTLSAVIEAAIGSFLVWVVPNVGYTATTTVRPTTTVNQ